MKTMKRFAALFAIAMLLVMSAVPAFAATCPNTGLETLVEDQYGQSAYKCKATDEFQYSATVKKDGDSYVVFLAERPNVDDMKVEMSADGSIEIFGMGTGDTNQWNNLFGKYRTVVVGVSGVGAITMIVFFIINFMKLGSSAGNPQARSQALTGVLWTGLAAAGLGAVSIIAGFFYNAL